MTKKLVCGKCEVYLPNGTVPADSSCGIYDLVSPKISFPLANSIGFLPHFSCLFKLKEDHDFDKKEVSEVVKGYLQLYVGGTRNGMESTSW